MFLPDYSEWDDVTTYMKEYDVRLFLLDEQLLQRRPTLFREHVALETYVRGDYREEGMVILEDLPGFKPVFFTPSPPTPAEFILFEREISP